MAIKSYGYIFRSNFLFRHPKLLGGLDHLKSAYAVAKMDKVRNTITVSTFADPSALAFVYSKTINPIAFQKNTRACEKV